MRIVAMIPARMGSTRLKKKNLALLNGKPVISYVINAAVESKAFDKVMINSEDEAFGEIARRYKIGFYKRNGKLATSETKSDDVVYDFIRNNPADIIAWVNSTSPLQSAEEIRQIIEYFVNGGFDSLITVKNEQVHCLYRGKPLNFKIKEMFARTQDLEIVQPFVYSVMVWRTKAFKKCYEKQGQAMLCGKVGYFPVSKLSSIIIKRQEDLQLAEYVLRGMRQAGKFKLKYDRTAK